MFWEVKTEDERAKIEEVTIKYYLYYDVFKL